MGKARDTANLVSDTNVFSDIVNERVGVGTNTPQYKLDVFGDVNFSGDLYQNSQPFVSSKWATDSAGVSTTRSVGINTTRVNSPNLTGLGNSFQGLYVSNGMVIYDNRLSGNHYIGTNFNGLMAGPVTIDGVLTIDGNYVVV
jgi:hypothetical protein